jgi:hypothetical protein
MWCLSRLLPLVIHDLIPEENPDWKLFYLAILIQEYLQEFKEAFPTINLIPKQHFMVHYPGQIRRCNITCTVYRFFTTKW